MHGKPPAHRKKPGSPTRAATRISHEDLERYATEHIFIEDELGSTVDEPKTVSSKFRIRNRVRGVITELTFYREGFVRVRSGTTRKAIRDYLLELRFIDPVPACRRRTAAACLWTAVGLGAAALLAWVCLPLLGLAPYAYTVTTLVATAALVALLLFVHRNEETHVFFTAVGKTEVLSLSASFGCVHRSRKAVRAIQGAVKGTTGKGDARQDIRYLKAEMQAHYRLAETGVISRQACSEGTSLILSHFG